MDLMTTKEETNLDHYKDEILNVFIDDLAMYGKNFLKCDELDCSACSFNDGCDSCQLKRNKWLNQLYEKPTYRLTKFEKELLQCYPDIYSFKVFNSLNKMKEKGYFKGIDDNELIGDILAKCEVVG